MSGSILADYSTASRIFNEWLSQAKPDSDSFGVWLTEQIDARINREFVQKRKTKKVFKRKAVK
jgi:hypothetical protein